MSTDKNNARAKGIPPRVDEPAIPHAGSQGNIAPDRRNNWFTAPGIRTVIGGLVTAAIGAAITGGLNIWLEHKKFDFNSEFERRKFESNLIQTALEAKDDNEKANRLKFLANAGLIDNYKVHVLATLPTFLGAAIRDHIITVGGLPPDGYIGPNTYAKLREAWPEHFKKDFLTFERPRTSLPILFRVCIQVRSMTWQTRPFARR